jgi:hypothetical protein
VDLGSSAESPEISDDGKSKVERLGRRLFGACPPGGSEARLSPFDVEGLAALDAADVRFVVIGGFAVGVAVKEAAGRQEDPIDLQRLRESRDRS